MHLHEFKVYNLNQNIIAHKGD